MPFIKLWALTCLPFTQTVWRKRLSSVMLGNAA
jgi:hypothetical protein